MEQGVVRHIDPLGRLVIPKEIRKELGLNKNEPVEMTFEKDCVIIKKYKAVCILCGKNIENNEEIIINDKKICQHCQDKIKQFL